ncbi:MAG: methylenetetrahydrofolate reductase [Campylobacteraceae bacterium]|jgi:5,10-methylenetetrahydrofolate reductase|nr:methylenetetrahydrofolate reductase [Campylobacteraceae bacterium]
MYLQLKDRLYGKEFISLEITPMHGGSSAVLFEKINASGLKDKIDAFVVTDNPLAKLKSDSIITAFKLQEHFSKPAIATVTMRDRNKIALQSSILGANELNVTAVLALTGDPAASSNQPNVKGVFEANSTLLLEIIKCFNAGIDYAGKEFGVPLKPILSFAVCNSRTNNPKTLQKKLISKLRFNPAAIITQPVYEIENAKWLKSIFDEAKEQTNSNAELILGFFPVTRLKTAQFLNSHVSGIHVPQSLMYQLANAKKISEDEEFKIGVKLSKEIFSALKNFHPKLHLMGANNFKLLDKMIH